MKKLSFLALAAVGLLFGACSSSDVSDEVNNPDFKGKTGGYFKINLNLPTAPVVSTRAWAEDGTNILNDGLAVEYGVNTCVLLLFDGASETTATLTQAIDLTTGFNNVADDPNHITTNKEVVAKLNNAPTGNLYAMAVINGKNNIEFESATSIKLRGTSTSTCTIGDLQAALATSSDVDVNDFIYDVSGTKYFFMTNAVLSLEKGGTVAPATAAGNQHILAPVNAEFIYDTEAAAVAGKAATDIYVERGVAKVTIGSATLGTTALTAKTGVTIAATLDGWCLDNTNTQSYVVRQVPTGTFWNLCSNGTAAATDKYRFVGANAVDAFYGTTASGYRTYWAKDPNYNTAGTFSSANYATKKITGTGDNNPLYCLENTFDVEHQIFKETTRAIIGVTLTSTGTFYIMGADRKTLYPESDVKNKIVESMMSTTAFSSWYSTNGVGTLSGSGVTVAWSSTGAGKITVTGVTIPDANIGTTSSVDGADWTITSSTGSVDGVDFSSLISTLNDMLANVERFENGVAYYSIRIKHFGDDLTPWNTDEFSTAPKEATIDDIYPNDTRRDANYLGRYGMVRNNWYDLQIGDILKVGASTIPDITTNTHPDDELEDLYIKARINILSWARRPQAWNLKN
jgi:hypothetical protein